MRNYRVFAIFYENLLDRYLTQLNNTKCCDTFDLSRINIVTFELIKMTFKCQIVANVAL